MISIWLKTIYQIKKKKKCRYLFHLLKCILKLFETFWLKRFFKVYVFFCSDNIYHYGCSFFSVCSQRTEHLELTSIRCRYYVQTSKTKYSRSLFLWNLNEWKVDVVSTYFLWSNFNGWKINFVLTYLSQLNFDRWKIDVVLTYLV